MRAIDKDIPISSLPADASEHGKNIWWKVKKWSLRCLNRLFSRYGNPQSDTFREGPYVAFAKRFTVKFAPNILNSLLAFTNATLSKKQFIPDKVMFRLVAFFSDSIQNKITWAVLQPHVESLVTALIFPLLAINEQGNCAFVSQFCF